MRELERQALLADRQSVVDLLAEIDEQDAVGRRSFEARLAEIDAALTKLEASHQPTGQVALLFAGGPVRGARSIDADFATRAISEYRALVEKQVASREIGQLGSRGPLPMHSAVYFSITDIVRGSVGFVLEENAVNHEIADTVVKQAIDEVTWLISSTASNNEGEYEQALEALDPRQLVSLKQFFRVLDDKGATLRILDEGAEAELDGPAVRRGRRRIDRVEITEHDSEEIVGELIGILVSSKRFEMRLSGTGEIITGRVAAALTTRYLQLIETPDEAPVGREWRTKMRIREVREINKAPRQVYTLIGLLQRIDDNP